MSTDIMKSTIERLIERQKELRSEEAKDEAEWDAKVAAALDAAWEDIMVELLCHIKPDDGKVYIVAGYARTTIDEYIKPVRDAVSERYWEKHRDDFNPATLFQRKAEEEGLDVELVDGSYRLTIPNWSLSAIS